MASPNVTAIGLVRSLYAPLIGLPLLVAVKRKVYWPTLALSFSSVNSTNSLPLVLVAVAPAIVTTSPAFEPVAVTVTVVAGPLVMALPNSSTIFSFGAVATTYPFRTVAEPSFTQTR